MTKPLPTAQELLDSTKTPDLDPFGQIAARERAERLDVEHQAHVRPDAGFITAFTVAIDSTFKAHIFLDNRRVEMRRKAKQHDFDVAALWIEKWRDVR